MMMKGKFINRLGGEKTIMLKKMYKKTKKTKKYMINIGSTHGVYCAVAFWYEWN